MSQPNHPSDRERPPRVLFLRNSRGISDVTGAETYLLTVIGGLISSGCEVRLLCSDMAGKGRTAWHSALAESEIPHQIVDVPHKTSLADVAAARALCRSFRPDVLHAMDHRSDLVAVLTGWLQRVPAVASFFGWTNWQPTTLRGRLYPVFDRFVMRRLRKVIVDSAFVGTQIRSVAPLTQIAVIPNGVNLVRFDPERVTSALKTEWFGSEDVWLVGMIGRIHPNKGQIDMAETAAQLLRTHPKMRFVVLGDPPQGFEDYARHLQDTLQRLGITDRFLVTNLPSRRIPEAIASFDATAIPSYMESLSYVMLESMAMRKPVVSARVGGHGDLIRHGENGFLFTPGDTAALERILSALVRDPALARSAGDAGRQTVMRDYSTDAMIARTRAVYHEVMQ